MQPDKRVMATWQEKLWSTYVRLESSSDEPGFFGRVQEVLPGSNLLSFVSSTRQLTERTPGHFRSDQRELVLLSVQIDGQGYVEQEGRQARLDPGDLVIYDTTRPYRLFFKEPFRQLVFRMPREAIERRVNNLSRRTAVTFDGRKGAVAVARGFVRQLAANAALLGEQGIRSFEAAAADMISTAIRLDYAGADDGDRARYERLETRLRSGIRGEIEDFEALAAAEGMSLRTFQRLFQIHGTTPTRWILEERLKGVAEDLRKPALTRLSITELAFSWGFNDLSHFNRAFRTRFGVTPSVYRQG